MKIVEAMYGGQGGGGTPGGEGGAGPGGEGVVDAEFEEVDDRKRSA